MQLSGAVVDLLDLQGSSVAICLEDGWDTTAQVFGSATLPRPLLPHPGRLPRPRREGVDRLPPLQPPQQPQRQLTNGFRSGRGDVGVVDNSGSGAPKKTDDKSFYSLRTSRRTYNFCASAEEWLLYSNTPIIPKVAFSHIPIIG
ncbi:uncharacterized protein [Tenebrio molitor]|uniref:uncharacterized protein n=1 Tax=Tenebrio molitor TaxID=7067 RepID=UPI0036246AB6